MGERLAGLNRGKKRVFSWKLVLTSTGVEGIPNNFQEQMES